MKVLVGLQMDYPVIALEKRGNKPQQPSAEEATDPRRDRGRGPARRPAQQVDMADPLFDRYEAARAEWVEVQRLLFEELGEQLANDASTRQDRRRATRFPSLSEWVPDEQVSVYDRP